MLSRIIAFSIRNKLLVGMMVLALIGLGAYHVSRLPVDAVPDITNNQVLVITSSPSLGAADIERLITFPIEQSTRNIPGIIEQRSFSRFGLSLVTIVFNDETDVYWARQQISERLIQLQAQIPPSLGTPTLGPVTTGLGEIFQYVVRPKPGYESRYDAMELRTIQDWIIRRQLLGTPGVADVSSFGGKLKQYEVSVNYDRLRSYNLTISEIFSALEKNNQNTGGAYIEKGPAVLYIRTEGLVQNEEDIAGILIRRLDDGRPLTIRDVAEVRTGAATRYGAVTYNDQGEVAGAVVMMLKGGNSNEVIRQVKSRIEEISKTLPEGVMIEAFLDRTKMVNSAIGTVEKNLLEGALIVVFVLVLFLGNLRAGLLVASVIPLSMLFAIIMMNLFGVSGNLMSLGALDFGLIIDGAVIIVEAVMHRLHANKLFPGQSRISQEEMDGEVQYSAGRMMNAAVFGQVIILIVYLPILSLQGIEGKMFKPMAQTVAFAIAGAFLLSLTYVPMMSTLVLSKKTKHKPNISDRMMGMIERGYKWMLLKALRIPALLLGLAAALFTGAIIVLTQLGGEFIPKLEEGDFAVDTRVLTGSSLTTTIGSTQQAAGVLLKKFPEVEKVVTKIGSGEIPTDPMPMEASDMMVILRPKEEWTSAKSFDELAEKMSTALQDVPGITVGFQFPVQMRFNELMTGGRQDVVCKIFGENLDSLAAQAAALGAIAGSVEGARDVYVEQITGLPQILVRYNRDALRQFGLSVGEVNNTLSSAFAGSAAGEVYEQERRFDLVVRLDSSQRRDINDVRNLLLPTATGMQVPLSQVADVDVRLGPGQIQRENAQRRISVGFNVRGRDVESIVKELQKKVSGKIKLPPGYYITYGGQFENLIEARKRLMIAVPVSLLLIFVLLYFAFNSVKQGLLVYTAIPLSAIGGVFALLARDMPFSISAGIGFIALFGVAVLNGIVLITEFNQLKKSGMMDIHQRILKGTNTRLRPVLMTAAVASMGFLPMALSNGAGAEVQRPLATVVIGGLVSATLLTLFLLPLLYRWSEGGNKPPRIRIRRQLVKPALIFFLLGSAGIGRSQTISLEAAVDSALKHHPQVRAAELRTRSAKQLERTASELPSTAFSFEYGSINSAYTDTRAGITQGFNFPIVYRRRASLLKAQTGSLSLQQQVLERSLKGEVSLQYYEILMLRDKQALLLRTDSLFANLLKKQEQRLAAGDINMLEKTATETQRAQIANQLALLTADLQAAELQLQSLMGTTRRLQPQPSEAKAKLLAAPDTAVLRDLPSIRLLRQQEVVAEQQVAVQRSALAPGVSLGYVNQSLRGVQNINGVDKFYSAGDRFSSVMAGLSIPIFRKAQKARIEASRSEADAARADVDEALRREQLQLRELLLRHERNRQQLERFEQMLGQARMMRERGGQQLAAGAISFVEWMLLTNQWVQIETDYFNALSEWNQTVVALNLYTNR